MANFQIVRRILVVAGLLVGLMSMAQVPAPAISGGVIQGTVHSGSTPLPGASISAANVVTKETVNTASDINGQYSLRVSSAGGYVVKAEMTAFSPAEQQVGLESLSQTVKANFDLTLLSRATLTPQPGRPATAARRNLSVNPAESVD